MIQKKYPLIISLVILYCTVAILLVVTLDKNEGDISYPLDDTFIHMAIAKNFALKGVWGITPFEFSSTTSSPLYTFILACAFYAIGINPWIPLVLNVIFGILLLLVIDRILISSQQSVIHKVFILLGIIFLMPLPILILSGMEHVLHTLFTLLFVGVAIKCLEKATFSKSDQAFLILWGVLLSLSRYEGLFVVFAVCCFIFLRKKFLLSFVLGIVCITPLIIYGIISVKAGSYWLPNSVLLKGHQVKLLSMAGIENLYSKPLATFSLSSWLFTLTILLAFVFIVRYYHYRISFWNKGQLNILIFFITLIFHVELAQVGWLYRYEAYLMAWGLLSLGLSLKELYVFLFLQEKSFRYFALVLTFILLVPIVGRGVSAIKFGPKASNNIYDQQYQMGRFLQKYYNNQSIAANDIGAINFLADLKCLDIVGLGSIETAKAKREGTFGGPFVEKLAKEKRVKIALVYDRELKNSPTTWTKVGTWKIQDNVIGASNEVSFYAVEESEAVRLRRNMIDFKRELPEGIEVNLIPQL